MQLSGVPIVCVGLAEWDAEIKTNQHHLMSRLARESPVLFVESLGLRQPTVSSRDIRRMARRLARGLRPLRRTDNVQVLSPLVVPYHRSTLVRRLNDRLLRRAVGRAVRALGFESPILWTYAPQARVLVGSLRPRLVVYHCVDDLAAQDGIDAMSFRQAEEALARDADLVIATSAPLRDRLASLSDNVALMTNVADTTAFAEALEPGRVDVDVDALSRPRILFVGAVSATKVDLPLLGELARLRPEWNIVAVGPIGLGDPGTDVSDIRREPNIHFVGPRTHHELPGVLRGADAGIIPYRINELTASVFPLKVYEYLAAGLPTVSTPLPSLREVEGIRFAATAAEMAQELDRALAEDSDRARRERSRVAQGHSWDARLEEIDEAVSRLPWRR